jgi:hypothetical protein
MKDILNDADAHGSTADIFLSSAFLNFMEIREEIRSLDKRRIWTVEKGNSPYLRSKVSDQGFHASVSRRSVDRHFSLVRDCYLVVSPHETSDQ